MASKGLYIFGIVILIILLIVGILLIVYKNKISSTNPNSILIIGIILIVLSLLLLVLLFFTYPRHKKVACTAVPTIIEPVNPEKIQFQTNKPVIISITPANCPAIIEAPKPFKIDRVNVVERPVIQQVPIIQQQIQQNPYQQIQIPMIQQSPPLSSVECTIPNYQPGYQQSYQSPYQPVGLINTPLPQTVVASI
jgi:hypothetical protein